MELTKEKRLYKFDNLKFILIFLVVLGHMVEQVTNNNSIYKKIFIFVYTFHMPLFIFIVGLFQKKINSFKELPFKKIAWYIFLVYFMKITAYFFAQLLDVNYGFSVFGGGGFYWFLWTVSLYIIVTPLIGKFKFYPLLIFSIIFAAFCGYDSSIGDKFQLLRTIVFFPFYLIGYGLNTKKEKIIKFCNDKWLKIDAVILLLLFSYICFNHLETIYPLRGLFTGRNSFASIKNMNYTYITRLITYLISFIIGFAVLVLAPNRKIPVISKCGTRTLQIYVIHRILIIILKGIGLFDIIAQNYPISEPIIIVLISLLMTLVLSLDFIEKIFNYVRDNIFKSEKT